MNVLMISPAYPAEMRLFTRGLARVGAQVIGLSEQPPQAMPIEMRHLLAGHVQVPKLFDEAAVVEQVRRELGRTRVDRVECLWEPGMILAARLREALGVPGMTVAQTLPFRDKEKMKQVLDAAGIRTPRHSATRTEQGCREAAERIGFPLIVKPIAGGGSADTYRVDDMPQLERILPLVRHVEELSVEEFIDGEELTYDTICANRGICYEHISWYRPRPLEEKRDETISPQTISLRNVAADELKGGRAMGRAVLQAMGYDSGFTHMEWFRKSDGEVVFGEIGARPPGARMVDLMNYASDIDVFTGWADAICHGKFRQHDRKPYNAAMINKRARGQGRIQRIDGLDRLRMEMGSAMVAIELLPIGAQRRNWKMTSVADGFIVVRHADLQTTLQMADRVGNEITLHAG